MIQKYLYPVLAGVLAAAISLSISQVSSCVKEKSLHEAQIEAVKNPAKQENEVKVRVIKETKTVAATETTPQVVTVTETVETSKRDSSSAPSLPSSTAKGDGDRFYIMGGPLWKIAGGQGIKDPGALLGAGVQVTNGLSVGLVGTYFPQELALGVSVRLSF